MFIPVLSKVSLYAPRYTYMSYIRVMFFYFFFCMMTDYFVKIEVSLARTEASLRA